ncbi:LuxR C-terminal-related transcriptional regulator [Embleya sp. NPDC005971]|uniref:helix-turn-helix transcriptional regulator n=1 Tax=Embleya sp. NPDC005971 TaxID=3156724 RepID=UPI0033D534CE
MTTPPPRLRDHVRARLLDEADRRDMRVSVAEIDRLALAAFGAVLESAPARLENRTSVADLHWREAQVLEGVGRSLSNARIAAGLGVSEETVKAYLRSLMAKLGAHTRMHVVLIALTRGLLRLEDLIEPAAATVAADTAGGRIEHGTLAGHEAHLANGTAPCTRCHAAHSYRPSAPPRRHPGAAEVIARHSVRDGDHVVWLGPAKTVAINGRQHGPARASWLVHVERVPHGRVQAACEMPACIRPAHLMDAADRQRSKTPA